MESVELEDLEVVLDGLAFSLSEVEEPSFLIVDTSVLPSSIVNIILDLVGFVSLA